MRTRSLVAAAIVSSVAFSRLVPAQQPRDTTPARQTATGTAIVEGIVMSDDTPGVPLRRATVSLIAADLITPLSTVTGDDGRFAFGRVPAGTFTVAASKPAYVGTFLGSKSPGRGPGVPLALRDGQHVTGVVLRMLRGGVIAGHVRGMSGQPATSMTVNVVAVESIGGVRRLRLSGGRAITDDRGEYRIYGLLPGDYVVQVQPAGILAGVPSGVNDAAQTTAAEVSWAHQPITGGRSGIAPAPPRGGTVVFAPIYFPGTADPSGASIVTLAPREERDDVDLALQIVPTSRVAGVVIDRDGQPLSGALVSIASAHDATLNVSALLAPRAPVRTAADGSFTLAAIAPGDYIVRAESGPGIIAPGSSVPTGVSASVQTMAAAAGSADSTSSAAESWAMQEIVVEGRDEPPLMLAMRAGLVVSGRVVFERRAAAPLSAEDLTKSRVVLVPVAANANATTNAIASSGGVSTAVRADGSFAFAGLAPCAYRLAVSIPGLRLDPMAASGTWSIRSMTVGQEDALDRTIEITPSSNVTDVAIVLTDRPSVLSGALVDALGRPALGYPILVFSTDRRAWVSESRRVVDARPATDGTFRLVGLPAGRYYLCAVSDIDRGELEDPAFLETLAGTALTVTLADGVVTTQNLRLGASK